MHYCHPDRMGNALDEMQEFAVSFHFSEKKERDRPVSLSEQSKRSMEYYERNPVVFSSLSFAEKKLSRKCFVSPLNAHTSFDVRSVVSLTIRIIFI